MSYHPAEWDDDERMRVLMGRMPPPTETIAYNSRISIWSEAIHRWIKERKSFTFSVKDAETAFRRGTQVPLCLPQVVQHLRRQGEMLTFEEFGHLSESETWFGWTQKTFILGPPKWIWQRVKNSVVGNRDTERIIDWKSLREVSDNVYSYLWKSDINLGSLISPRTLLKLLSHLIDGLDDLHLVLNCLQKKGCLSIALEEGEMLIKFATPGDVEAPRISSTDIALHKLYAVQMVLDKRLSSFHQDLQKLKADAKHLLLEGRKKQALVLLRRKKRLEASLEKTAISHDNISQCIEQIQESTLNRELLNTFQLGVSSLKSVLSENGSIDDVSDAMAGLQDTLDECSEITQIISNPVSLDTNDDELESELEQMLKDLSVERERDTTLPDIPTFNPLPSDEKLTDNPPAFLQER